MYRLISASADCYITNKYIENSRSLDANVGQAGTLDMFKLYDETTVTGVSGAIIELTRGLIKFDYTDFSGAFDISSPNFTASVRLKNVYGGQTTPSNFTLALYPLSKAFDEGRGFDVATYRDIDTANFLKCSTDTSWSLTGAAATGSLGQSVDVIVSGNLGAGMVGLGSYCTFERGDEDGVFNVTRVVSASLAGILPNHGFRLSFISQQEQDSVTRFVKRFGTKQALSKEIHPKLIVEYNDQVLDTTSHPVFGVSQSFFVYNSLRGNVANFVSGGVQITGSNSLVLQLVASKSVSYYTSSYQANFAQIITHKTSSTTYFSQSFNASQYNSQTGMYVINFNLDTVGNTYLSTFVSNSNEVGFDAYWKSLDGTVVFARKFVKFKTMQGEFSNSNEPNYFVNITNLKEKYSTTQDVRLNLFIQDRTQSVTAMRVTDAAKCTILNDVRWRLRKAYSKAIVVPFAESTRLSSNAETMYFDIYMSDLDINEVYELEFLIKNDQGKDILISDHGFTFKVVE
jgi:hypothetical protein